MRSCREPVMLAEVAYRTDDGRLLGEVVLPGAWARAYARAISGWVLGLALLAVTLSVWLPGSGLRILLVGGLAWQVAHRVGLLLGAYRWRQRRARLDEEFARTCAARAASGAHHPNDPPHGAQVGTCTVEDGRGHRWVVALGRCEPDAPLQLLWAQVQGLMVYELDGLYDHAGLVGRSWQREIAEEVANAAEQERQRRVQAHRPTATRPLGEHLFSPRP